MNIMGFDKVSNGVAVTQQIFICSESTIEILEKGVKYFQS